VKTQKNILLLTLSQFFLHLGSSLASFAMLYWGYSQTGKATTFAMIGMFFVLANVITGPFAGIMIDRHGRKTIIMACDTIQLLFSLFSLTLIYLNLLSINFLYILAFSSGVTFGFQNTAIAASVSLLSSKEKYISTNAILRIPASMIAIAAPPLSAIALQHVSFSDIIIMDIFLALIAMYILSKVSIPNPKSGMTKRSNIIKTKNLLIGINYIISERSILFSTISFFLLNFFLMCSHSMIGPLILRLTNNNEILFSIVQSSSLAGALLGSIALLILVNAIKPGKHIFLIWFAIGMTGPLLLGFGDSLSEFIIGAISLSFLIQFIYSIDKSLWQIKVPEYLQGKVFSIKESLNSLSILLAFLISGPFVDQFLPLIYKSNSAFSFHWTELLGYSEKELIRIIYIISGTMIVILSSFFGFMWSRRNEFHSQST